MTEGEKNKNLKECLEYFRERPVYKKFFSKWREKYAGLGYLGGKITLTGLDQEEKAQLSGFFQKDYTESRTVTISAQVFEKSEVKVWECRNCGHIVVGTKAPAVCPVCNHPQSYFEVREENY